MKMQNNENTKNTKILKDKQIKTQKDKKNCTYSGARTHGHWLKRPALYQLSYAGDYVSTQSRCIYTYNQKRTNCKNLISKNLISKNLISKNLIIVH